MKYLSFTLSQWTEKLVLSAKGALNEQTPATLLAYSCKVDLKRRAMLLKAHFQPLPTEDDVEDMQCVETEIIAHFYDWFDTSMEIELVQNGYEPQLLSGAVVYRRRKEAL